MVNLFKNTPLISSFYGIVIKMYFGDYLPPHFHAEYADYKAHIAINGFSIVEGYIPPKALALVVEWASINQAHLIENWKSLSESGNGSFIKIEPLR